VLERASGLFVCPISGVVRDDLRACGAPGGDDGGDDDDEAAAAEDFGRASLSPPDYLGCVCALRRVCFMLHPHTLTLTHIHTLNQHPKPKYSRLPPPLL
jgi:hypothetical protein